MSVLLSPPEGSVHASCVAWNGAGVLISGPSGSGKSELALRLMDAGFDLVADDRVLLEGAVASAPARLAGLIEVRGVGILKVPFVMETTVRLRVCLGQGQPRLPESCRDPWTGEVMLYLEPHFRERWRGSGRLSKLVSALTHGSRAQENMLKKCEDMK